MGDKFKNKYRIGSTRKPNWDYKWQGIYFITICTGARECYFGDIVNEEIKLSQIGRIANEEWIKTPMIRPDMNLRMDEFIIMPNHIHGLIEIGRNEFNSNIDDIADPRRFGMQAVSTSQTITTPKQLDGKNFGPQRKNLSSIIRGFKSAVTVRARKINPEFSWQSRFYDSIVKDDESLRKIQEYIKNNLKKWAKND